MNRLLVAVALAALGCKSDTDDPEPAPEPEAPAPPTRAAPSGDDAAVPADAGAALEPIEISLADRCASPCLLLAEHRFAALNQGAFCEVCKKVRARACELEWPPIEDEPSCDDWDRWRRCLLAAHGYRFRAARFRAKYRRQRWYRPRRGVSPSALGPVARANHEYLRRRARACREALAAQKGRVIARLRGDLDGDRKKERAVVTDTEVRIGRRRVAHGLQPTDPLAAIEASLIDIDASDRAVEILVVLHRGEAGPSRYAVIYVAGEPERRRRPRPGPLSVAPPIETFGVVEPTGDGTLEVREQNCGQIVTRRYAYDDGELALAGEDTEGQRDPDRCR